MNETPYHGGLQGSHLQYYYLLSDVDLIKRKGRSSLKTMSIQWRWLSQTSTIGSYLHSQSYFWMKKNLLLYAGNYFTLKKIIFITVPIKKGPLSKKTPAARVEPGKARIDQTFAQCKDPLVGKSSFKWLNKSCRLKSMQVDFILWICLFFPIKNNISLHVKGVQISLTSHAMLKWVSIFLLSQQMRTWYYISLELY